MANRRPIRASLRPTLNILLGLSCWLLAATARSANDDLLRQFQDPPREFSVMPFWFWNDDLNEAEIIRQIADFEAHGVYGFVIHPRIGLPKEIGWLSPRMIALMRVAIEEAARRKMLVILYDEGMYPSGSSSGQVVARNPAHAARGLWRIELAPGADPELKPGWKLLTTVTRPNGSRVAIVDRPSGGVIRGLHYLGDENKSPKEDSPAAADILNPEAVRSFIDLVYERFARELGSHFGKTIIGVFTDEPSELGRGAARGMVPGSAAVLAQVNRILGYDFTPHLADLWYADTPEALERRAAYHRAITDWLATAYYRQLGDWCERHKIALTGHPAGSTDIGFEQFFQIPGQDLVWRYVVPGKTALEGPHSTMAKCASSAMLHNARRRNLNELYGAYGHNLTYAEMDWLASWCFVRGQNLLTPHAFYYSVRGPRRDERPPDVGPNSPWWDRYKPYADACRRLSWLNTDSRQVCEIAILADAQFTPDKAAAVLFQHQRDFNYLELRHLTNGAKLDASGVHLADMTYRALIVDGLTSVPAPAVEALARLAARGRLIAWETNRLKAVTAALATTPAELISRVDQLVQPDVTLSPRSTAIRYRHVVKGGRDFYLLFNEQEAPVTATIKVTARGPYQWWEHETGKARPAGEKAEWAPHQMRVLAGGSPGG